MSPSFNSYKDNLLKTPRKWLLTGVAGFIGSNLLKTLLELDQFVIGLDNFSTGFRQNIDLVLNNLPPSKAARFSFIEGDIRDKNVCKKATQGVDIVLHQAALGSVPRSINDPITSTEVNVTGFVNMLFAAKEAQVKRFVYASSSAVYGDSPILPKKEGQEGKLLSPYAASKYTNEIYAESFLSCYPLEIIGLRYFNVFGPYQHYQGPYAAVIPIWISSLIEGKACYINGSPQKTRDFCYIENTIQANLLAALSENPAAFGKVFNIAVGEQTTLLNLFTIIRDNLGLSSSITPNIRDERLGDISHSLADINLATTILGYSPTHTINQGMAIAVEWYKKNANLWNTKKLEHFSEYK